MALRMAKHEDIPQMLAIYAPYVENTTYSFEYTVPTLAEFTQRFESYTTQFPWLVWEEQGQVLGYAYGSAPFERTAYRWCAESSVYLHPDAHRKGIGKKLYTALEKLLQLQGYRVNYALITSENQISLAFHEALGYRYVADMKQQGYKHGRWLGVVWMEKVLNLLENPDKFPIPLTEIVKDNRNLQDILDNLPLS